jgi:hypothetical protein
MRERGSENEQCAATWAARGIGRLAETREEILDA